MKGSIFALGSISIAANSVLAVPTTISQEVGKRASTCNTAEDRACWSDGFSIDTNYMESFPDTGVTRQYVIVVSEAENISPDGIVKPLSMLINGSSPGPTLYADWGDHLEVTVINELTTNGTSTHWHGVTMMNNNPNDGVNGITECPTAPGKSHTYRFRAEQHGTSWYHSHFSTQYGTGVAGALVVNGPATSNYDVDLGPYMITDYYYKTAEEIYSTIIIPSPGIPPSADNILFNGTHVNADGGGSYSVITMTQGKTHRLRLINPSVDAEMILTMENHNFTIVAIDFVPVTPRTVNQVFLAIGQRLDVIINADQEVGNYWFNMTFPDNGLCGSSTIDFPAAIVRYEGAEEVNPTGSGTAPTDLACQDLIDFVPHISVTVPSESFNDDLGDSLDVNLVNNAWRDIESRVYWTVSGSSMNISWGYPTLAYLRDDNEDYPTQLNALKVADDQEWSYWVINNELALPHPMHLHGHDFYILGSSGTVDVATTFNSTNDLASLNFVNPTRRDVTMLPGLGWIVLAFKNNNPGAWLMHCHIAWHVGSGLSVQFIERPSEIKTLFDLDTILDPTCTDWNTYYADAEFHQEDSGL
ncbi:Laccase [Ceratocystis platani]|uniref:laccase n=1 Tax=Ceratocystis fimbriata f. sp. platani TaxID=88771 RepID=A0A0F8BVM3_CERFI|nr:Laccase [Ceratocystis platani]